MILLPLSLPSHLVCTTHTAVLTPPKSGVIPSAFISSANSQPLLTLQPHLCPGPVARSFCRSLIELPWGPGLGVVSPSSVPFLILFLLPLPRLVFLSLLISFFFSFGYPTMKSTLLMYTSQRFLLHPHRVVHPSPRSIVEHFCFPRRCPVPVNSHSPILPNPPSPGQTLIFVSLKICLLWTFPLHGII